MMIGVRILELGIYMYFDLKLVVMRLEEIGKS